MKRLEWALAVIIGLILLLSALGRIFSSDMRGDMADTLNVPGWFLILVSLLEISLAVDLFLPRFRILGGVGAGLTMIGAAIFNAFGETIDDVNPRQFIPVNLIIAAIAFWVAWHAGGRPTTLGALMTAARNQLKGQFDEVSETAAERG